MARLSSKTPKPIDPLAQWLSLSWTQGERSYNPHLRELVAGVLGYPKAKVIVDDRGASGFPDLKLQNPNGLTWVVGELKISDIHLTDERARRLLWNEKRKYIDGLTRFMIFVTAHYLWVVLPDGTPAPGFDAPLDLRSTPFAELQGKLAFLSYEEAEHGRQWSEFVKGDFPFNYLLLNDEDVTARLRGDLQHSFAELTDAATTAMGVLKSNYDLYAERRADVKRNLEGRPETQSRALVRLDLEWEFERRLFQDALRQFEDQYGREVEQEARVREAFIADSVAALMARVLFLRLVEDLEFTKKRRLSNGGPKNWAAFVEELTGDARMLVRVASADVALRFPEPFERTVFDWIHHADGALDEALQRLILRLNAYHFAGLSEEILGDIYQQFLPRQKRKRLGEYYTPPSIVDWILDKTTRAHGVGKVLDPSCGSGSFLVRYTHARLEAARERGLDPQSVRDEVQEEVWGFDLNPFASFISLFQVTWALLRFSRQAKSPTVHIYNVNSLLRDTDIISIVGAQHLPPGSVHRDNLKWKYIVGNPPYIRAERVKYSGEMQQLWQAVWGQNADTGLIFLYRALHEWLEEKGWFGMVVSGGYANSEAAAKVWRLLQPESGEAALRAIVWLEFAGKLWDANVIPMILIIEKTQAKPDDEIELFVPKEWPSNEAPTRVQYSEFFDHRVSPRVSNLHSPYGDYLLPLLQSGDVPILRKLFPDNKKWQRLGSVVEWTYGIQRGGVDVTEEPTGTRPIPVVAGRSLAVAWPGIPMGFVDLDAIAKRPNGKLSLWKGTTEVEKFVVIACISLAPIAAVIQPQEEPLASLNNTIVSRNSKVAPEIIAAFINSKLAQYYWAVRLRSAVLEGSSRATHYPRNFEALPWPKVLTPQQEKQLADGYEKLSRLAARAKDNPNEWLLEAAARRNKEAHRKLSDPILGLRFPSQLTEAAKDELQLVGSTLRVEMFTFAEFCDADLAEFILRLLSLTGEETQTIKPADIQKLIAPSEYSALMQEYRARMQSFSEVEADFAAALTEVDNAIYDLFEITAKERAYIETRLSSFPLNRLKPRYPWQTVKARAINAYMEDRFV